MKKKEKLQWRISRKFCLDKMKHVYLYFVLCANFQIIIF
ncbi:hypothetical protein X975_23545, partial [Stegodyphus mimosarum]